MEHDIGKKIESESYLGAIVTYLEGKLLVETIITFNQSKQRIFLNMAPVFILNRCNALQQ